MGIIAQAKPVSYLTILQIDRRIVRVSSKGLWRKGSGGFLPHLVCVLILFLLPGVPSHAQEEIPANAMQRVVRALSRTLAFDANLASRAGGKVSLLVLFKPTLPFSVRDADRWHLEFQALSNYQILGMPFETLKSAYTTPGALRQTIQDLGVDAILVCQGLDPDVPAIRKLTRDLKVISLATRESQINQGLSLGVFWVDGKAMLEVNLPATKEEGSMFGSEMLKLAKVIR